MSTVVGIPQPPKEIFRDGSEGDGVAQVTSEINYVYWIHHIELPHKGVMKAYAYTSDGLGNLVLIEVPYDSMYHWAGASQGINVYKFGGGISPEGTPAGVSIPLLYPEKSFPTPEAVQGANFSKRFTLALIELLVFKPLWGFYGLLALFPWKLKVKVMEQVIKFYFDSNNIVLRPQYLADECHTPVALEAMNLIHRFFLELGIETDVGRVVAMILECDAAYRGRFQDIMSEAIKENFLRDPVKELDRLIGILAERDPERPHLVAKFKKFRLALKMILMLPKIKRAFLRSIEASDFAHLGFDVADRYHALFLRGYNFLGRTIEDRWEELGRLHNGNIPPSIIVSSKQPTSS